MTNEKLISLYNKLRRFSFKHNFNQQDAEDFISFAIIKIIEGKKANFRQMLVDFYRKEHGDKRYKGSKYYYKFITKY